MLAEHLLHDHWINKEKQVIEDFEAGARDKVVAKGGPNQAEDGHFQRFAECLAACLESLQVLVEALMAVCGTVFAPDLPDILRLDGPSPANVSQTGVPGKAEARDERCSRFGTYFPLILCTEERGRGKKRKSAQDNISWVKGGKRKVALAVAHSAL